MKPSKYLIYALSDPRTDEVRYIGRSSSGLTRPRSHLCRWSYSEHNHKAHWIITIGLKPNIEIIEEFKSHHGLDEAEKFYIACFRNWGFKLTNQTDGGEGIVGYRHTPENKIFFRQRMIGKQYSLGIRPNEETRKRLSESHKGKTTGPHSEERKIKNSRSQGGKPVLCSNGVIYESQAAATRALGLNPGAISAVILGKRKKHHGFTFRYVE